ncbi:MAG: hypothetical protein J6P98_04635, partial [Clostridia bacterium]|nr:hypothetical protein [Clostridia bacterium]
MKKILPIIIAIALAAALGLCLSACKKDDPQQQADATDVPVITESPEGDVTAGPTATPETPENTEGAEPDETDVPVITQSPEGDVTAGPTATPEAPAYTDVPIVTAFPGFTAGPTATPEPPEYTNVPIVTSAPSVTAGPTATPSAPEYTNVPIVTAAPVITAGPTATPKPTPTPKPTATPKPTDAPSPAPGATPDVPHPAVPNDYSVHYAGQILDCTDLKADDTFYWTFDLASENSCLYAGHWLVDFDERYLEPISCSETWSGGLLSLINATWDDEEAYSDKPLIFYNANYEGMTGQNPYGEAGNHYTVVGLSLTT